MTIGTHLLEATNLAAAGATLLLAALVARELWRLRPGVPRVAIVLIVFFVALAADRVAAPDPILGYSKGVDAATDVILIALLAFLVLHATRLARGMLATLDAARFRAAEYARARRDYSQLVSHRLANPLTAIQGAAYTLQRDDITPEVRQELVQAILDAAERTISISLAPERMGPEEHELDATPRVP